MPHDPVIERVPISSRTRILATLDRPDIAEAQQIRLHLPQPPSVLDVARMPNTPRWVHVLTYLRDVMTRPLGFSRKNHQPITANTPDFAGRVGEQRGDFTVIAVDDDEIVLGQEDAHQSVRLGYRVFAGRNGATIIQMNTAVQFHTLMGELYFGVILPLQRQIIRADLDNLQRQLRGLTEKYTPAGTETKAEADAEVI